MSGILILFHNSSTSGFASRRHEITFSKMAFSITRDYNKIHFAFTDISDGRPPNLPKEIKNIIAFDSSSRNKACYDFIINYIKNYNITIGFGFDLPVRRPVYKAMRKAGMRWLISYIGAPMSSLNTGVKLYLKKIDVMLSLYQPDHYIFQSEGMRKTATNGRGIPFRNTSVVLSGTDIDIFFPSSTSDHYAHSAFNIDHQRKIIFFSGNMAPRKGVDVIMQTAAELVNVRKRHDIHFLLVGNRWGQEKDLLKLITNTEAEKHVTFGGYRGDVPQLLRSCYIGMIASTGWDSYPMSAVEMAATELPIVVSDLPGLREAVTPGTGMLFPPGDFKAAAGQIEKILDNQDLKVNMGKAARQRVLSHQTMDHQASSLESVVRKVIASHELRG